MGLAVEAAAAVLALLEPWEGTTAGKKRCVGLSLQIGLRTQISLLKEPGI